LSDRKSSQEDRQHPWDPYSDQPYIIRDKAYKKRMKRKHLKDYLFTLLTSCLIFPIAIVTWLLNRKTEEEGRHFFSLCVNLDKGEEQYKLVEELGCESLQVRFFLSDMDRIDEYCRFIEGFNGKDVLLLVVQSREHINDPKLLAEDINTVFAKFSPLVQQYQIGTTINRSKWGFFSVAEYLRFYQVVQTVRDENFSQLRLLGPSVIDFEYPYLIRALFNGFNVRFDKIAALLYVDRRGAPENTQMGVFDTLNKIGLLHSIARLSRKTSSRLLLTEANWPLEKTAPWAPTSETECVSESDYANFMLRYYLQALASKRVESVYWHQLIAPGYGLVDSREGLRKRDAFQVFKTMIALLENVEVRRYLKQGNVHELSCFDRVLAKDVLVLWCNETELSLPEYLCRSGIDIAERQVVDKLGVILEAPQVNISDSPIYLI
jgi:hypothetical protein